MDQPLSRDTNAYTVAEWILRDVLQHHQVSFTDAYDRDVHVLEIHERCMTTDEERMLLERGAKITRAKDTDMVRIEYYLPILTDVHTACNPVIAVNVVFAAVFTLCVILIASGIAPGTFDVVFAFSVLGGLFSFGIGFWLTMWFEKRRKNDSHDRTGVDAKTISDARRTGCMWVTNIIIGTYSLLGFYTSLFIIGMYQVEPCCSSTRSAGARGRNQTCPQATDTYSAENCPYLARFKLAAIIFAIVCAICAVNVLRQGHKIFFLREKMERVSARARLATR